MRRGVALPDTRAMQRTRLLIGALAVTLVAGACGGDDGGSASADTGADEEAAPTTTAAPTPANPEGDFHVVRWLESSDTPGATNAGLTTLRLWSFEPTCDGDEPCDLTLTGGGEGGSYDPPGFPEADPLPDVTATYDADAEAWTIDEDLGAYGNCLTEDGQYLAGDYTTMDEVDHTELSWDEDAGRLVGTKTETYTLNDAGRANPECSADADEVLTYRFVAIPSDDWGGEVADEVDLADSYRQTREVYSVEGTEAVAVYDWRVNLEPTEGGGSCDPDECDAMLTPPSVTDTDQQVLELGLDDGDLSAAYEGTGSCSSNASIAAGGEPEILTDEGYDVDWELELTPVVVEDGVPPILVGDGGYTSDPLPEAAAAFPDDCATTETVGAYWYFLPDDLLP